MEKVFRVWIAWSGSSEYILIWCSFGTKEEIFELSADHEGLQINCPYWFYQGHLCRETELLSTRIRFRNFSVSDERGSI